MVFNIYEILLLIEIFVFPPYRKELTTLINKNVYKISNEIIAELSDYDVSVLFYRKNTFDMHQLLMLDFLFFTFLFLLNLNF